ncbi:plasmid recombination protein, partial [Desulfovibrio sp. OttesenSCG-928-M14]|nr:plasmid recombination protein [Desulfovibrio sp. OttesenSCG-928-M14]
MSFLVLHMDKFKKEAVRGIQSHNRRERESRSNPDIDYERSAGNYDLHEHAAENYSKAIQNRIDDLLLVKAVRKDAVHMCGLIVSSDSTFFEKLSPEETRRFFEESKAFLTEFVGAENVISAMVHMDEKTPHMHFMHVPVTPDGRLNANKIYTRESLKMLQTELPRHLQSRGFDLQRGVEQEPGAKKKHLNTREFKQQQEALHNLEREAKAVSAELEQRQREESALRERLQSFERQAQEAEKVLAEQSEIPPASMFNFKSALESAKGIIERQKQSLAVKSIIEAEKEKQRLEIQRLHETVSRLKGKLAESEAERAEERQQS